jgi:AcrR family transcriptional regulator
VGRRARFDKDGIASAAMALIAEGGPRSATIAAIAREMGGPTGSIYHRYPSRELLLADLWLGVVEGFQSGLLAELDREDPVEAAVAAALYMPRWVRRHLLEARVLLLHRREDFLEGPWPPALRERAEALGEAITAGLLSLSERCYGSTSKAVVNRVRFAVLDVPYGAVKHHVQAGKAPPRQIDELVELTVRTVLDGAGEGR